MHLSGAQCKNIQDSAKAVEAYSPKTWILSYHQVKRPFEKAFNQVEHIGKSHHKKNIEFAVEDRRAGVKLLESGVLVDFKVLETSVSPGVDQSSPVCRIQFSLAEDEEEAEVTSEWATFGFLFSLAVLSFADARPRGNSKQEYAELDEFTVADFFDCLRFIRGQLHLNADYIRGRAMKTDIVARKDGTVTLTTWNRGKAAFRWIDRLKGKKTLTLIK